MGWKKDKSEQRVKRIAESHGGSVTLAPALPQGCEFRVELPLS